MRIDRYGADIAEEQRVAVWRRARRRFHADITGGAGAVVDDELLAKCLRQARLDEPDGVIRRTAGREGHDDVDRLFRVSGDLISRGRIASAKQRAKQTERRTKHTRPIASRRHRTAP